MDVQLQLRRALALPLGVALSLGVDPTDHLLNLRRALQPANAVTLALGSTGVGPVDPGPYYRTVARLASSPAKFRAAGYLVDNPYRSVLRLSSGAPSLRAAGYSIFQPYAAVVRLKPGVPSLRAAGYAHGSTQRYSTSGAWRAAPALDGYGWKMAWQDATKVDLQLTIPWGPFTPLNPSISASWLPTQTLDLFKVVIWASPAPADVKYQVRWTSPGSQDRELSAAWLALYRWIDPSTLMPYHVPPFKDRPWEVDWRELSSYGLDRETGMPYFYPPPKDKRFQSFPWGPGGPPDYSVHYDLPPVVEPAPVVPRGSYVCIDLHRPLDADATNVTLRLRRPLRTYCDTGSFIVNNSLNVITLIDGLALECLSVTMKLDISSFAWDLSLTLATAAEYARVKPSPAQDGAREVQITCNGYVWRGFIDTVSLSREFGNPTYNAQGKSFSAYGAAPFAPLLSGISATDELTQQLANDAFQYLGFTITWAALDWVVPAGLLSYENKDPMSVVAQIASAGGMFILPGRYDKSFIVKSRYPVTTWHWDDPATPTDGHLPLNQMISASAQFQAGIDFTKVYVSGTAIGNTVGCTRDGTDGSSQAVAVVDPLLATDDSATERGRVELCRGGARIFNTYVTPLVALTASGVRLREVGELVAVDENELDDNAYKGLVTSVQVTAARTGVGELTVYQTLEVERHV